MADVANLRSEDGIGLGVAAALHVGVVALLLLQPVRGPDLVPQPKSIAVSLATDVSLESTAPDPVREAAAATAPVLGEEPVPELSDAAPPVSSIPPPQPSPQAAPPRAVSSSASSAPRKQAAPSPRSTPTRRSGGGRIGDDFLPGSGTSATSNETRIPANQIGRSAKASLQSAINRQIKPHWSAPSGVDAEKLVSVVSWRLGEDGTLRGSPRCKTNANSITASNRPQAALHCERAIRAVRQAAPFDLPDEYYEAWKNITAWRFDRRL